MVKYQCYICNNSVHSETNEDIREKYYNIIGHKLHAGFHLCYICSHYTKKLWNFKTTCLNRGFDVQYGCDEELNWSLLFRLTKDTENVMNLEVKSTDITIICSEETCQKEQTTKFVLDSIEHDIIQELCYNNEVKTDEQLAKDDDEANHIDEIASLGHSDINDGEDDVSEKISLDEDTVNDDGLSSSVDENNSLEAINTEGIADSQSPAHENSSTPTEIVESEPNNLSFTKILLSYEEQKAVLETQRKNKKYIEAEFKCYSCAMGFLFKDSYHSHMVRHEESNGQYSCNVCNLRFATQNLCYMHTILHSERYVCSKCQNIIKRPHRRKHTIECWGVNNQSVSCHLCGKLFKDSCALQQHIHRCHYTNTNKRIYSCNICGKTYTKQGALRTHMIKHTNKRFQCDQCPSTFSTPCNMRNHKKIHSPAEQDYCASCDVTFKTRKYYREHLRNSPKHQQISMECSVCGRAFSTRRGLDSHMEANHTGTKAHACSLCPARYATKKSLIRHAKIHTDFVAAREFVCHLCGNCYTGKSKLNRHLRDVCERPKEEPECSTMYIDPSICAMTNM